MSIISALSLLSFSSLIFFSSCENENSPYKKLFRDSKKISSPKSPGFCGYDFFIDDKSYPVMFPGIDSPDDFKVLFLFDGLNSEYISGNFIGDFEISGEVLYDDIVIWDGEIHQINMFNKKVFPFIQYEGGISYVPENQGQGYSIKFDNSGPFSVLAYKLEGDLQEISFRSFIYSIENPLVSGIAIVSGANDLYGFGVLNQIEYQDSVLSGLGIVNAVGDGPQSKGRYFIPQDIPLNTWVKLSLKISKCD